MAKHKVNQTVYYTSGLLDGYGIKHGFFTRLGGLSPKPFDSLNMKRDLGDDINNVLLNRQHACQVLDVDYEKLVFAYLGHKDGVHIVTKADAAKELDGFDTLMTVEKGVPTMLSVADCAPIIMADQKATVVAVVHVSWRSLVAGIVERTVESFVAEFKKSPEDLLAAFGPAIQGKSYEVGEELIQAVSPRFEKFLSQYRGKPHFDIPAAAKNILRGLGVKQIDDLDIDTYTNTGEFYSYRKEGKTGRFAAIVSL